MGLVLLAGCATQENLATVEQRVSVLEQSNRVQDQRLKDMERGTASVLEQQAQQTKASLSALEQQAQQTKASLEQQAQQSKTSLEQQAQQTKASLEQQAQQTKASLEQQAQQSKASLEQQAQHTKASLEQQAQQTKASLEQQAQQIKLLIAQAGTLKQELAALGARHAAERESMLQRLAAAEGSARVLGERSDQLGTEQTRLTDVLEKTRADLRLLQRRSEEQAETAKRHQTEQLAALDAVTQHLDAVRTLLQSPIGNLPGKTEADKLLRRAYAHLMYGEVDLAADRFADFIEKHANDPRLPEAQYRQAQAYFLGRKYDHALVPAFALVDKNPNHPLAPEARWILARSLEEKGDFALARRFYSEMIDGNSKYKSDAMRRVQFLNVLQPAPAKAETR
jgi:TolA-binding protein